MSGESKASKNRISAAKKQAQALALRAAGASYETIAFQLGYASPSGAYKAVSSALRKTLEEPAAELRTLELNRLDGYLLVISPEVRRGNLKAIDRALKISERRSKLLGLDQAIEVRASAIVEDNLGEVLSVLEKTLPQDLFVQCLKNLSGYLRPEDQD